MSTGTAFPTRNPPPQIDITFLMKLTYFADMLGHGVMLNSEELKKISILAELWNKTKCNRVAIKFTEILQGNYIMDRIQCNCGICSKLGPQ